MRLRAGAVMLGGLAVAAAISTSGVSNAASVGTAQGGEDPVTAAVTALTTETADRAIRALPTDFSTVLGYTPTLQAGMVVNPSGDCSSPISLPTEFDIACKAHDLGYDLLRYAAATHTSPGPEVRRALDAQLDSRMHDACAPRDEFFSHATCITAADVATQFVAANSWRQDYGVPVQESLLPYGAAVALLVGAAVLALSVRGATPLPSMRGVGQAVPA